MNFHSENFTLFPFAIMLFFSRGAKISETLYHQNKKKKIFQSDFVVKYSISFSLLSEYSITYEANFLILCQENNLNHLSITFAASAMLHSKLFLLYLIFPTVAFAQTNASDSLSWVTRNPKLDLVVNKLKELNEKKQTMPGYRIQVYFGTLRSRANEIRALFNTHYPDIPAAVSYSQPNFKVRAGDFRTRLEAQKNLRDVMLNFPGAFVVPDEIRLPQLK
jgi:hypothetical protein